MPYAFDMMKVSDTEKGLVTFRAPFRIDFDLDIEHRDAVDVDIYYDLINDMIKDLTQPLIDNINKSTLMSLDLFEISGEDTQVLVTCDSINKDKVKDVLILWCKGLDNNELKHEETIELDREWPEEDAWDGGHYTRNVRMSDDEAYDYFHSEIEIEVTFKFDEDSLEVY